MYDGLFWESTSYSFMLVLVSAYLIHNFITYLTAYFKVKLF